MRVAEKHGQAWPSSPGALVMAIMVSMVLMIATTSASAAQGATPSVPVPAASAAPLADDPALEARVLVIAEQLRCLVCQNETIAASRADLANDLRMQIRLMLREGRSTDDILDFMVQRYGDFVLYKPPFRPTTWLLWVGPFVLGAGMLLWLARMLRRRSQRAPAAPMSEQEARRARALLEGDGPAAASGAAMPGRQPR